VKTDSGSVSPQEPEYEAPQVERVLDADELEREVLYAGDIPAPISS